MKATKRSHSNSLYQKILSLVLSVAMIIGCMPISNVLAADGNAWTISADKTSATIEFSGGKATFHSAGGDITLASAEGIGTRITTTTTNGKVQNATKGDSTGRLYQFDVSSYCDFVPTANGTLTLKVGNATAENKDLLDKAIIFGLNRMAMTGDTPVDPVATPPTDDDIVGWFVSGLYETGITGEAGTSGTHSDPDVIYDVTQDGKYNEGTTTLSIKIEEGYTYFFGVSGSKLGIYDINFTAEGAPGGDDETSSQTTTEESEPPVQTTTEGSEPPAQTTTDGSEPPAQTTTEGSEPPAQTTTEDGKILELGDVSGDGILGINDAVSVLTYVLDKTGESYSKSQLDAAEVSGDKKVTAIDAAQIVAKVLDPNFNFTRTDYNPGGTTPNPPATEASTESTTEGGQVTPPSGAPTLWVLGDSTVCDYTKENTAAYNFRNGWGMALDQYVDTSKITIKNIAKSGRSTRDFRTYNSGEVYKEFTDGLKEGDYVLIQFGHNDEKEPLTSSDKTVNGTWSIAGNYGKSDANGGISTAAGLDWQNADENGYVAVDGLASINVADSCIVDGKIPSFEAILYKYYVKFAQDRGAKPILVTPVVRADGAQDANKKRPTLTSVAKNDGGHINVEWKNGLSSVSEKFKSMNYVQGVKDVATYANVPVIDLTASSKTYWEDYLTAHNGSVNDLHANVSGDTENKDATHLSKVGAAAAAKLVIDELAKKDSNFKEYLKDTSEPSTDETTEAEPSTEETTESESTSQETTNGGQGGATIGNDNFKDVAGFEGYACIQNSGSTAAVVDMADENDIAGNSTSKIHVGNKGIVAQLDESATSGKYVFSMDFLTDYENASEGRTLRLLFENSKNTLDAQAWADGSTYDNCDDALGYITEGNLTSTDVICHMTDVAKVLYVTPDVNYGKNSTGGGNKVSELTENRWYHMVIEFDFDAKTTVTKIYDHGATYAPDTDWSAATPINGAEGTTEPFGPSTTAKLSQIRMIRTAGGNIYFDNIKFAKAN